MTDFTEWRPPVVCPICILNKLKPAVVGNLGEWAEHLVTAHDGRDIIAYSAMCSDLRVAS